eukprot:scaffold1182_cov165-Amphora_coffeaeformis.AAC.3
MEPPKAVVIKNPYAKKKRATPPAGAPPKPPPPPLAASSAAPAGTNRYVATTFSQAFGGNHHQSSQKNNDDDDDDNDGVSHSATSSLQQHASPQQQTVNATAHPNLTDRESHVLTNQPHVLYVSHKQKGNAVLTYIRNVPMAYSRMVPDFILSAKRCALFLSCKYHALYPNYIHRRIAELGRDFELRVLLVLVDVQDNANTLRELNKLCVLHDLTLILSWSEEEAARYLETYKAFDGKDATLIQKREQTHFADQVADFLTACKTVNKTDSATLLGQFGSLQQLARAGPDDLALVAGMGQVKVKRLFDALHKPFSTHQAAAKRKKGERQQKAAEEAGKKSEQALSSGSKAVVPAETTGDNTFI